MGNYFFQNATTDLKPQNKLILRKLRRVRLEKVLEIFRDYIATFYPNASLDSEQFDDLFSPLLNNTTPFFKIL